MSMYQSTYQNNPRGNPPQQGGNYNQPPISLIPVNPNAPKLLDTVQEMSWAPLNNSYVFACACWDGTIRFYTVVPIQNQPAIEFANGIDVKEPCICLDFRGDGMKVYCGLANGAVLEVDVQSKQIVQIGQHDSAVRNVFFLAPKSVVSISFDKTVRMWDISAPNGVIKHFIFFQRPTFEYKTDNIPVVAAQFNSLFIFADNEQRIWETDWEKLRGTYQTTRGIFTSTISPLNDKSQISAIDITPKHLLLGSIDGRINIQEITAYNGNRKHLITFKGHKTDEAYGQYSTTKRAVMWPISSIQGNQVRAPNWMTSAGGEGDIHIWDYHEKNKIKTISMQMPITCSKLSHDGNILAFACGNDWHRGMDDLGKTQPIISGYAIPNNELYYVK